MAPENTMSTPIFDELLREMTQRAEPSGAHAEDTPATAEEQPRKTGTGRRHRAE